MMINVATNTDTVFRHAAMDAGRAEENEGEARDLPREDGHQGSIRSGTAGIGGGTVFSFGEERFYPLTRL
jgi:hypothetical protein